MLGIILAMASGAGVGATLAEAAAVIVGVEESVAATWVAMGTIGGAVAGVAAEVTDILDEQHKFNGGKKYGNI